MCRAHRPWELPHTARREILNCRFGAEALEGGPDLSYGTLRLNVLVSHMATLFELPAGNTWLDSKEQAGLHLWCTQLP